MNKHGWGEWCQQTLYLGSCWSRALIQETPDVIIYKENNISSEEIRKKIEKAKSVFRQRDHLFLIHFHLLHLYSSPFFLELPPCPTNLRHLQQLIRFQDLPAPRLHLNTEIQG